MRQAVPKITSSSNRGEGSSLTVTSAFGARGVAGVAVPDAAVGAGGILTTLGAAQGRAPLSTFIHVCEERQGDRMGEAGRAGR